VVAGPAPLLQCHTPSPHTGPHAAMRSKRAASLRHRAGHYGASWGALAPNSSSTHSSQPAAQAPQPLQPPSRCSPQPCTAGPPPAPRPPPKEPHLVHPVQRLLLKLLRVLLAQRLLSGQVLAQLGVLRLQPPQRLRRGEAGRGALLAGAPLATCPAGRRGAGGGAEGLLLPLLPGQCGQACAAGGAASRQGEGEGGRFRAAQAAHWAGAPTPPPPHHTPSRPSATHRLCGAGLQDGTAGGRRPGLAGGQAARPERAARL
jgi:hypothetical protein